MKSYNNSNLNEYEKDSKAEGGKIEQQLVIETGAKKKIEMKVRKIFRQFSFSSITFHLFFLNCIVWLAVHFVYYFAPIHQWDCVQYYFFAKFQPSITYNYEFWRLILSSFMFRGGIQFYFNNFALNMLGYIYEKQSKIKFLFIFYGGILAGHMLSCCLSNSQQLTVGTSCGTIALLPIEVCRYIKLRRTNPIQACSRLNFLIFNILTNFMLNILAIFHLDSVDWVSHIGCIAAGLLFLVYYEIKTYRKENQFNKKFTLNKKRLAKIIQFGAILIFLLFIAFMAFIIWFVLPRRGKGREELNQLNFLCSQ